MKTTRVPGKNNNHKVVVFALSTCVWCKRTKQLLKDNGIEYEYADIDLCPPQEQEEIRNEIRKRGGNIGFPAVIIDDKKLITGYREEEIKEALGI